MYLAPLNYDRFFKKVFSETRIAQRFLEDFFDVTIESIEPLPNRHKVTDDSTAVEFDFRCKMNGQYVIVDMQQWYKPDYVKRFYVYHCINSALQLENMPLRSFPLTEGLQERNQGLRPAGTRHHPHLDGRRHDGHRRGLHLLRAHTGDSVGVHEKGRDVAQ